MRGSLRSYIQISNMHLSTIILVILTFSSVFAKPKFHESLSTEDLRHYFGTEAREEVPEYEIVHPVHLSGSRHRRKHPLQYHVSALGEEYHLNLHHNEELVAPGCLVTTVGGEERTVPCPVKENDCYYHGVSSSHVDSTVAVSTCTGLHGIISTPSHDLIIQPIREHHIGDVTGGHPVPAPPHIAYRNVARKKRSCGLRAVADNLAQSTKRRMRRQAGKQYIEMLLVADKTMYQYHKDDLTHYMLTAANVAAGRYLDDSLGVKLYMTVIRIKILQDDQPGLSVVPDADKTLSSFCKWQEKFNPAGDNDPLHVDAATFMTKVDLVHLGVESTTGLATLGGMCTKNIRCSVLQDDGLDIGLTLAHETGHSLSMHHDGENNACTDFTNIMSTGGGGGPRAFKWSKCSKDFLNKFLKDGNGNCLNDSPQGKTIAFSKDLPGVVYSGEDQCRFFVGEGSSLCEGTSLVDEFGGDECAKLICFDPKHPGSCIGSQTPRMDGTECGHRKWCQSGKCTDIGPDGPKAQDGGWSVYTKEWTACSRTCGGGVRYKSRKCNNPRSMFGGKDCSGSDILAELCNIQDCSTSQLNYKQEQCAATDKLPLNGQVFHWIPQDTSGQSQCQLYCMPEGQGTVRMRVLDGSQNYRDGTDCRAKDGSYGRCVAGKCKEFGCDGVSDSGRTADQCGVCSGNGDTCKKMTGTFNKGEGQKYVSFQKLKKGTSGIVFTNKNRYSTMSMSVGGSRIFNKLAGQRDRSGTYSLGGVTVKYRPYPEKMEVVGTLAADAEAEVYRVYGEGYGDSAKPDISYEFYVPLNPDGPKKFVWRTQDGQCSVTCGQGSLQTEARCVKADTGSAVDNYYCSLSDKPSSSGKECTKPACPSSWRAGSFSTCSKTCAGGVQTRTVECVRSGQVVGDDQCKGIKPLTKQNCNTMECPGEWRTLDWSTCSKTCSRGVQTRTVKCYLKNKEVADSKCQPSDKPATTQSCLTAVCNTDITGDKCADASDCADYDTNVCADYADWAKTNCMVKCGYCEKSGGTGTGTTAGGKCEDTATDCKDYGTSACTEYKEWAGKNCASFCGFCKQTGGESNCKDSDPDTCSQYGQDACTKYAEWAKENCASSCNLCGGSGGSAVTTKPQTGDCTDKDTATCEGQGASACSDYPEWAQENCAHFCNLCATSAGNGGAGTSAQAVDSTCTDKSDQCSGYDDKTCADYKEWAMLNCKKRCGFCEGKGGVTQSVARTSTELPQTTTMAKVVDASCSDTADCAAYGASVCTGQYAEWASLNCKSFCGLCGGAKSAAAAATTAPQAETTVKVTTKATPTSTSVPTTIRAVVPSESVDSNCKDVRADCQGYGLSACTEYGDWAKQNCQKFCGFCGQDQTTQAVDPNCMDTQADCAAYGLSACTKYAEWAASSCKKFCNLCGASGSAAGNAHTTAAETTTTARTTTTTVATTTTAKTTVLTTKKPTTAANIDPNCKDVRADCKGYGLSACTEYGDWAKQNCQKFCGFCGQDKTTQAVDPNCMDTKTDCAAYGHSTCTKYPEWAASNCKKFCNLCGASGGAAGNAHTTEAETATTARTTTTTTTTALTTKKPTTAANNDPNCKDVRADCEGYGLSACTEYGDWAKQNCQKFCGFCGQEKTTQAVDPNCMDTKTDCAAYGHSTCTKYPEWAASNCKKFCNLCGASGSGSGGGGVSSGGTTQSTVSSSGCEDAKTDCASYPAGTCTKYADWAKQNCQKFCKLC